MERGTLGQEADRLLRIASLAEQFNNQQIATDARSAPSASQRGASMLRASASSSAVSQLC